MTGDDPFARLFGTAAKGTWSKGDEPQDEEPGFRALFSPVGPFNRVPFLSPVIAVAGAAAVLVLTGVAAASLVVLSLSLLAVLFLLTQVFGYEIVMPTMPMPPR